MVELELEHGPLKFQPSLSPVCFDWVGAGLQARRGVVPGKVVWAISAAQHTGWALGLLLHPKAGYCQSDALPWYCQPVVFRK